MVMGDLSGTGLSHGENAASQMVVQFLTSISRQPVPRLTSGLLHPGHGILEQLLEYFKPLLLAGLCQGETAVTIFSFES